MYDRDYSEKRDFIRMYVNANIRFCKCGESEYFEGSSESLSGNGVAFVTNKKLKIGDQLDVIISSEQASVPPLEMKVSVVRVDPRENESYEVAGSATEQR